MQTHTILVTQAEYDKAADVFAAAPGLDCRPAPADEASLAALVRETGCRAVVLGVAPYRDALYNALADNAGEAGALIVRFGLGTDSINKPYAAAKGIKLVNTPVDIHTSVAELTLFLIGSLMRRIPLLNTSIRNGGFTPIRGRELCGQTALIIGGGKIGLKVCRMLHLGFGVRTLVCDSAPENAWLARAGQSREALRETFGIEAYSQELDSLLPLADLVTIHLPLTPETSNLIGSSQLARMKPGSVLVNVGRGGIVNENALYDALASGHLAGAATDVFVNEPYVPVAPDKDLRTLPNVVMTPHCGSNTFEANARMAASAIMQAKAFLGKSAATQTS
ncbi:MAG: NAD(P)-dependent oxidoreductase [Kiritimatiellae bacterium]|nr:NAD(P)-dependent oxidoreductase [Kiritimatiellia bacterium]